jgi:hypothetical protein
MLTLGSHVSEVADRAVDLARHHAIWWKLVSHDTHTEFECQLANHKDFLEATADAHFQASLSAIYQLLDERSDSISLVRLLTRLEPTCPALIADIRRRMAPHDLIFSALESDRSRVYAHRHASYGPELVFRDAAIAPGGHERMRRGSTIQCKRHLP